MFCRLAASLTRGGGDADDLAAGGDQFQGLLDALRGVHGVAGDHGLFDDGMIAADDDAAVGGIAHDHFAGAAPLVEVRRRTVAHGVTEPDWPEARRV